MAKRIVYWKCWSFIHHYLIQRLMISYNSYKWLNKTSFLLSIIIIIAFRGRLVWPELIWSKSRQLIFISSSHFATRCTFTFAIASSLLQARTASIFHSALQLLWISIYDFSIFGLSIIKSCFLAMLSVSLGLSSSLCIKFLRVFRLAWGKRWSEIWPLLNFLLVQAATLNTLSLFT